MTLQQLREAAKGGYFLDETTGDPALSDAQWNRAINQEYRRLCRRCRLLAGTWTGLVTVDGTREYTISGLTPGIAAIDFVKFKRGGASGSWARLRKIPAQQISRLATDFHDLEGSPEAYWLRGGNKLGLYPVPDADNAGANLIEIWGWEYPTALALDASSPTIDSNLHDHILPGARYFMAEQELAAGRPDAERLVVLYDRGRKLAEMECRDYVERLSDDAVFVDLDPGDFE